MQAGTAAPAPRAADDEQRRPNVVVVMTDDQTVESMRAMPQVQRLLADRGVTFANSFASNPVCCPSRATFLTGRYAHNTGVYRNSPPHGGYDDFRDRRTLPVALQRSGYFTAHIGKYLNGYGLRTDPTAIPPGWSDWRGSVDASTYRMYGYTLNENGRLVTYGDYDSEDPENYQTDVYAEKAVALIERRAPRHKPFFLNVAPLAPHTEALRRTSPGDDDPPTPSFPNPRPAPRHAGAFATERLPKGPSFNEADVSDKPAEIRAMPPLTPQAMGGERNRYRSRLASLLAVDDMVARIGRALRRTGELDDTLIVFTSDNGFLLGEHRIRTGKQYPYEESIRVPLVIRGPGVPRGETRRALAANVDLAPTILDYAGAKPPNRPDGRSLRKLMNEPRFEPGRAIALENWCQVDEACFDPEVPRYRGVRTNRYAYMEYPNGERELYDLERDPYELRSVHADSAYGRERRALGKLLARMRACRGSGCRIKPRLRLDVSYESKRVDGRRCVASAVLAEVVGADAGQALAARFAGPGPGRVDERRPLRHRLRRRDLPRRGRATISANVTVIDGRVETIAARVPKAC